MDHAVLHQVFAEMGRGLKGGGDGVAGPGEGERAL